MIDLLIRASGSVFTFYMLLILVRWTAPWIEFDLHAPRWTWIPRLTDPLLNRLRRLLPSMGPMDFGPLAALFVVWLARALSWQVLVGIKYHQ